jgi:hypothetical protein
MRRACCSASIPISEGPIVDAKGSIDRIVKELGVGECRCAVCSVHETYETVGRFSVPWFWFSAQWVDGKVYGMLSLLRGLCLFRRCICCRQV